MKISKFLFSFVVFLVVWLGLTMPVTTEELIAGAVIAFLVALLAAPRIHTGLEAFSPRRVLILLAYIPYFLYKMVVANIQLAAIVINPKLPIKPSILKGKTALKKSASKIGLANSITLTPGTLTVDIDGDDVYVHVVKPEETSSAWLETKVIAPFERFLKGGIDGK